MPPPTPPPKDTQPVSPSRYDVHGSRTRDPQYYHNDGSAVFLVEGVLFKFQASLIVRPDDIYSTGGPDCSTRCYPTCVDNPPQDLTSSSDENPITIAGVRVAQFRNFLFAVMGQPFDPEYRALINHAQDISKHTKALLMRYLDIASVARQFGMSELEKWARSRLCLVVESPYKLASNKWDYDILLQLDSYARSTTKMRLISSANTFIQYIISVSVHHPEAIRPPNANRDTCLQLFRNPSLAHDNPVLFGYIFVAILSVRRQAGWVRKLEPEEMLLLDTAQAKLAPVSKKLQRVGWLQSAVDLPIATNRSCVDCQVWLYIAWRKSFTRSAGLMSEDPLQQFTTLSQLPLYRGMFETQWDSQGNLSREDHFSPLMQSAIEDSVNQARKGLKGDTSQAHGVNCPQLESTLAVIDKLIHNVYRELAHRRKDFVLQ